MSAPNVGFHEWFDKVQRGELPKPPIAKLLGFEVTTAKDGAATVVLDADARLANPMGTLHGGVLVNIADAAMGCALASTLVDGETFTTVELKANFFKPIWSAQLTARARVVRRTRALAYLECDIVDESDSLVAKSASTCMVLRGTDAAGR